MFEWLRKSFLPGSPDRRGLTVTERRASSVALGGKNVPYATLFETSPSVHAVVSFLSMGVSGIPFHGYVREPNGPRRLEAKSRLETILRQPNPGTTAAEMRRDVCVDMSVHGFSCWIKVLDDDDLLAALVRTPPSSVSLKKRDDTGPFIYVVTFANGTSKEYARDELLLCSHFSPDGSGLGISPLASLSAVLAEERASTLNREAFWRNSARMGGWASRPLDAPPWDDDVRTRWLEDFKSATQGENNAGDVTVFEEGMLYHPDGFSPRESEFTEAREQTLRLVCAAYGVPAELVAGIRNIDAHSRAWTQQTLAPLLGIIEESLTRDVVPACFADQSQIAAGRVYVEGTLEQKLRGNYLFAAKVIEAATGGPYMSVNEARKLLNLPPIDGGDELRDPRSQIQIEAPK